MKQSDKTNTALVFGKIFLKYELKPRWTRITEIAFGEVENWKNKNKLDSLFEKN